MSSTSKTQVQIRVLHAVKDRGTVDRILYEACQKFQLFDNTKTSTAPNTIRSIVEREYYGFGLGARVVNELIVIDFFPHKNPSSEFDDVRKYISDSLLQAFPENAQEVKEGMGAFIGISL